MLNMARLERHEPISTVLLPLEVNFPRHGSAFALIRPTSVTAQILNLDFNGVFGHLKTFSLSSPNFIKSFGHDLGFGFLLSGYSMLFLNSHILHLVKF